MSKIINPYGDIAPTYQSLGFWARPVIGKKAKIKDWQKSDGELGQNILDEWQKSKAADNIALLMGSPFPDGTRLGALDIDHDGYVELGRVILRDPPCGRIGSKGAVFFVRTQPNVKNMKLRVKGELGKAYGQVLEIMAERSLIVIPPSIHPETNEQYKWIGTPLHELDYKNLPIIGEKK